MISTSAELTTSAHDISAVVKDLLPNLDLDSRSLQKQLPALAKDVEMTTALQKAVQSLHTSHRLISGDSRKMNREGDGTVHLVVTSPPYWTLKEYNRVDGQLGFVEDYERFLAELEKVWAECLRVLVPGGRLVVVVGDVCLSRRKHGRHMVVPLHASIQESCRKLGFDNLAPIIWYKIANAKLEVANGSSFLGKPYEPNAVIKHDLEYILMQRKPGAYRSPSPEMRVLSLISEQDHRSWFKQIWTIRGESTRNHPAPFPLELAGRLVRMFSFVGDTVLDPFVGSGTTSIAAARCGRNSVGYDIDPSYISQALDRLQSDEQLDSPLSIETF